MPTPLPNETQSEYISRCIKVRQREHPNESVSQSVAICESMWKSYQKKKKRRKKWTSNRDYNFGYWIGLSWVKFSYQSLHSRTAGHGGVGKS